MKNTSQLVQNFLKEIVSTNNNIDQNIFYQSNLQFYKSQKSQFFTILARKLASHFNIFLYQTKNQVCYIDDLSANMFNVDNKPTNSELMKTKYRIYETSCSPTRKKIRLEQLLVQINQVKDRKSTILPKEFENLDFLLYSKEDCKNNEKSQINEYEKELLSEDEEIVVLEVPRKASKRNSLRCKMNENGYCTRHNFNCK
jgi:hypothetical protein